MPKTLGCLAALALGLGLGTAAEPIGPFPEFFLVDNFKDANLAVDDQGKALGLNASATLETAEPVHAGKPGGHSLWFTWKARTDGILEADTLGSDFDTLLAAYEGESLARLTGLAANDDADGLLASRIRFNVKAGVEYHLAVDGLAQAVGSAVVNWQFKATPQILPVITALTPGQTVAEGEGVTYTVEVKGQVADFQWLLNGVELPGENKNSLAIEKVTPDWVGLLSVRLRWEDLVVYSESSYLQINQTDGTVDRKLAALDKFSEARPALSGGKVFSRAKTGTVARGFSGQQIFSTLGSTKDPDEMDHCGERGGASQWFTWQPPTNGLALITTDGSNFDTVLAVYIGPGDSFLTLTNLACDNNGGANGLTSRVQFEAKAGEIYYIAVDGVKGAKGTVRLNYLVGNPPVVLLSPVSRTAALGASVLFQVTAQANPPPSFQWIKAGLPLAQPSLANLLIPSVGPGDYATYSVRISNSLGQAQSSPFQLLPEGPLTLQLPVRQGGGFRLSGSGAYGQVFVLEGSTNLFNWSGISTNQSQTGLFDFFHPVELEGGFQFYRVLVP